MKILQTNNFGEQVEVEINPVDDFSVKRYTLKVGEVFTQEKADELKEYLEAKDAEIKELRDN